MNRFISRLILMTAFLCLVPSLTTFEMAQAQSNLKKCPKNGAWNNCAGKWSGNGETYSGAWKNDKRNGWGIATYSDGTKYEGSWKSDKWHGQGKAKFSDGGTYDGGWYLDKKSGKGTIVWSNGDRYVGEFKNDKKHGQATYTWVDGTTFVGEYKDDFLVYGKKTWKVGDVYVGYFAKDMQNGEGTYSWQDGQKYVGKFKDDKKYGQGTYSWPNGEKYVGDWKDDKKHGQATYTWPDGTKYIGEYKDDYISGYGTKTWKNGDVYVGYFANDKQNGQGALTFGEGQWKGDKYVGEFKDDKFYGNGTYTFAEGDKYVGEFKDSKNEGQVAVNYSNGDSFNGTYQSDRRNGLGTYVWKDGSKFIGQWRNGMPANDGIHTSPAGSPLTGLKYSTSASYTPEGYMSSPDVLTYSGGTANPANNQAATDSQVYNNTQLCTTALNTSKNNWDTQSGFTLRVAEAKRRGLSIDDCRVAMGLAPLNATSSQTPQVVEVNPPSPKPLSLTEICEQSLNSEKTGWSNASSAADARKQANALGITIDLCRVTLGIAPEQKTADIPAVSDQNADNSPSISPSAPLQKKVALVIGNSAYQQSPVLANPHNDAEAVATTLTGLGFEVIKGLDLTNTETVSKAREFAKSAKTADVSLLYYAGHGLQIAGENYIVPVDAKVEDETAISFELINVSTITNFMGGLDKIGIILLDACRDNPFSRSLKRSLSASRAASVDQGLAPISAEGGGLFVAFSTAPGDVAADGEGMTNSPFTTALLKHLPTKGLEINTVMTRVKAEVAKMTKNDQRPWTNSDLTTEVYLAPAN